MNKMQITACALAVLAITSLPSLAKNIEVKVAGTITPSGCTPTLSGGGSVDYGTMASDTLTLDAYTLLDRKTLDLTITCDAPVKLALETKNGRPNTLAGVDTEDTISGAGLSPVDGGDIKGAVVVGLGLSGKARIGGYGLGIMSAMADSKTIELISRDGSSGEWNNKDTSIYSIGVKRQLSWGIRGSKDPAPFQNITLNLYVQAYINKASELDLTKPVVLDGLSTIELIYL
ncbi:MAG: DUF1120 domain-containing protein [Serratia liquefaciens]|nr:DUF1120 domain-containing protein [Serratia liquefaciens]